MHNESQVTKWASCMSYIGGAVLLVDTQPHTWRHVYGHTRTQTHTHAHTHTHIHTETNTGKHTHTNTHMLLTWLHTLIITNACGNSYSQKVNKDNTTITALQI